MLSHLSQSENQIFPVTIDGYRHYNLQIENYLRKTGRITVRLCSLFGAIVHFFQQTPAVVVRCGFANLVPLE
jgi:hypothetical protein